MWHRKRILDIYEARTLRLRSVFSALKYIASDIYYIVCSVSDLTLNLLLILGVWFFMFFVQSLRAEEREINREFLVIAWLYLVQFLGVPPGRMQHRTGPENCTSGDRWPTGQLYLGEV